MSLKFNYGTGVCSVPSAALSQTDAERIELLVLLHLANDPGLFDDIHALADMLSCTEKRIDAAIGFWLDCGILIDGKEERPSRTGITCSYAREVNAERSRFEARPNYDSSELAAMIEENGGSLGKLVEECQTLTGHIFSPTEVGKIAAMRDYLGLEPEHILMLFSYLVEKGKKSVSYIEKTAYNLFDEGITDVEKLDIYIKQKEESEKKERELSALIGAGGRSLLKKEKEAFSKWLDDWKLDRSIISAAYEETVLNIGKYNFSYLSKILENWYTAGHRTKEDVELSEMRKAQENENIQSGSFDQDEFLALAIKRSKLESDK